MVFVGVDVGTSSVKAVAFDEAGRELAMCDEVFLPTVLPNGTREMDSAKLWECTTRALKRLADTDGIGARIASICVSSFGEAFIAVDERGKELGPVMIFTDRRGEEDYYAAMKQTSDLEIAQICGLPPSITYSVSKLLYIRNHQRDIYDKTSKFLLVGGYVLFKLSGEMAVDYSLASRTMLFDIHKNAWSDGLIGAFGIDGAKLPGAFRAGHIMGKILPGLARELHINPDALMILGGHDQPMCALGAGLEEGRVVNSLGTSQCFTPLMDAPLSPEATLAKNFPSEPFVAEGRFNALGYNVSSGLLIDWFFKTFTPDGRKQFAEFEANAPKRPTKLFALPYLAGTGTPYMDHMAAFGIIGADPSTTRYDMYKACLEGLGMDMRLNMTEMTKEGIQFNRIVAVGGGSKSAFWLQIIADILGLRVATLECAQACALGAAIIGAAALKVYSNAEAASIAMSRVKNEFEPNGEFAAYYDEKFDRYTDLYSALKPFNDFSSKLV